MSLTKLIDQFIEDQINLNPSRIDKAKETIKTIRNFIKNDEEFKDLYRDLTPQGSYRQNTIIKPPKDNIEFDVDVLLLLKEVILWEPKEYISNLAKIFKNSDRYKDIIDQDGKSRCITLNYADDFHMDIVPCIEKSGYKNIMNKNKNTLEKTDGDGYAAWFENRNKFANNKLVDVVKLIKYLRDVKQNFCIKSILLTTLLGRQVDYSGDYTDSLSALRTILNRLNDYLQKNKVMPTVKNPVLEEETFNRHWDQDKYDNFRNKIRFYTDKLNEAIQLENTIKQAEKMQEIFGNQFPLPVPESGPKSLTEIIRTIFPLGSTAHRHPEKWKINDQFNVFIVA